MDRNACRHSPCSPSIVAIAVQTTVAITWVRDTRIARSGSRNDIPILGGAGYPHLIDTTALPRASHSRQRSRGSISSLRGACRSGAAIAGAAAVSGRAAVMSDVADKPARRQRQEQRQEFDRGRGLINQSVSA